MFAILNTSLFSKSDWANVCLETLTSLSLYVGRERVQTSEPHPSRLLTRIELVVARQLHAKRRTRVAPAQLRCLPDTRVAQWAGRRLRLARKLCTAQERRAAQCDEDEYTKTWQLTTRAHKATCYPDVKTQWPTLAPEPGSGAGDVGYAQTYLPVSEFTMMASLA
jgi:hypothetical protein